MKITYSVAVNPTSADVVPEAVSKSFEASARQLLSEHFDAWSVALMRPPSARRDEAPSQFAPRCDNCRCPVGSIICHNLLI